MNKKASDYIDAMGKGELIKYLERFVEAIELDEQDDTPEMRQFIRLHRKVISELSRQRIYKVCTVDTSDFSATGIKEYDVKYYGSLKAAKRELTRRLKKQRRDPFVAAPDEIQDVGIADGINPSLVQSIIGNKDTPLKAPGRYKFYEVRMLGNSRIIPIQFMLTSIDAAPAALGQKKTKSRTADKKCMVVPFESIKKNLN